MTRPPRSDSSDSPAATPPRIEAAHVLRSLADPLVVVDRGWRILDANPAAAALLGLPVEGLVGQVAWDLMPGAAETSFGRAFLASMETQRPERREIFSRVRERWFEMQSHPTGDGLVLTFNDITGHKRAARRAELMQAAAGLIAAAKNLPEGLAGLMRLLRRMGNFDYGELWLGEAGRMRLRVAAIDHAPEDAVLQAFSAYSAPLECGPTDGLPGMVWESRDPVFVPDLAGEVRFVRREQARATGLLSAAMLPVRSGGRTIGAIGLFSRGPAGHDDTHAMLAGLPEVFDPLVELRRSAAELDRLFNVTTDLACVASLEGWFLRVNPAFERVLGYSAAELTARPYRDFIHPDDREATAVRTEQLSRGIDVHHFENRYRTRQGGWRWLDWTAMSVVAEGLVYAFARDVTEEKRQREHDRLRREFFAGLATGVPLQDSLDLVVRSLETDMPGSRGSVLMVDREGRLRTASAPRLPAAYNAQVDGLAPGPLAGSCGTAVYTREPVVVAHIAGDPRWERYAGLAAQYRLAACWSVPCLARDGRVLASLALYFDQPRHPTPGEMADLTAAASLVAIAVERQRTTEELELLHQAVSRLNDVIMITEASPLGDPGPRIEFVNEAFERMTGYRREEVLGRTPRLLQGEGTERGSLDRIRRALEAGEPVREELLNYTRDGRPYWVELDIAPVRGPDGGVRHFVAVERDTTERRELQAQLLQAQKMEAIGRLAGGISHDFNNMLTAILGFSDLLLDGAPPGAPWREEVNEIRLAATRAAELTRQLLAFSRKQVLQPVVLDLNVLVGDTERMLRRLIGEHIALQTIRADRPMTVRVDPAQLEQALVNLAVNAADAMPQGGRLTIETAMAELDAGYAATHPGVTPGPHVMLAVSDTGMGMSREVLDRAFEPFFTTKPQGQGTGLGLSTVYGIVAQGGGHLFAYSEPGQGSSFKLYFPFVDATAPPRAPGPAAAGELSGTETILVVEDEELVRHLVVRILGRLGYRVLTAAAGDEALAIMATMTEPVHLLLTDVVMPGMTGHELAQRLLEDRPELKVLYVSGYTENTIVRHGVLDPGVHFLEKPFIHEALARKVREVLDGGGERGTGNREEGTGNNLQGDP
jgi:PAS domain S-box-containing protein